jgi:hypothetical protein
MPSRFGGWAQPNQNEGNMATAKPKAAQSTASTAPETTAPAATDETTAVTGEVAQTGAEAPQGNDSTETKTDEAAQPNQNEGDKPEAAPIPSTVKLTAPYGFIDDETGVHYFWQAGQVVTEATEVQLLVERQAPLE